MYNDNATIQFPKGLKTKTYLLQLDTILAAESPEVIPQIQKAVDTWNTAIGHTVLSFDSTNLVAENNRYLSVCNDGSLCFLFGGVFSIVTNWFSIVNNSNVVANTNRRFNSKGEITSSIIRLNREFYKFGDAVNDTLYTIDTDNKVKLTIDVEAVMLHELGHVLGLGHSTQKDSTMTALTEYSSRTVVAQKRVLSQCDINRVQSIYSNVELLSECQ